MLAMRVACSIMTKERGERDPAVDSHAKANIQHYQLENGNIDVRQ